MPKVSVIIPTCNRAHFLLAAIESVVNQTFQNFEIIVVDDASNDETPAMMRTQTDTRIRYIRQDSKKGQGATRNAGIRVARGDYIALLDDDDEWLPTKLEKQAALFDALPVTVGLIYTGFFRIESETKRVLSVVMPKERGSVFQVLCRRNWIGTCSTVVLRKACLTRTGGFDERLASAADYDLWLRIAKEFAIDYVDEPLVYYLVHDNRISTDYRATAAGIELLLRKYAPIFESDPKSYSRRYFSLGMRYCLNGNMKKGRKAIFEAIRLYPLEMRHYYNLALSFLGANNFKKLRGMRRDSSSLSYLLMVFGVSMGSCLVSFAIYSRQATYLLLNGEI